MYIYIYIHLIHYKENIQLKHINTTYATINTTVSVEGTKLKVIYNNYIVGIQYLISHLIGVK